MRSISRTKYEGFRGDSTMTVKELIEHLQSSIEHGMNPNLQVYAYDGDSEKIEPVSGYVIGLYEVELFTDEL